LPAQIRLGWSSDLKKHCTCCVCLYFHQ